MLAPFAVACGVGAAACFWTLATVLRRRRGNVRKHARGTLVAAGIEGGDSARWHLQDVLMLVLMLHEGVVRGDGAMQWVKQQ